MVSTEETVDAEPTPQEVLAEALAILAEDPDYVDAHYEAALAYEDLGRLEDATREFLEVLRLDSLDASPLLDGYEDIICEQVERTLAGLPADFAERLGPVTILVEPRPSEDMVRDGLDPRLLGLFDGSTAEELAAGEAAPTPTRILIFSHNLASAYENEVSLRDEVTITVLHEIGHFFGLEEEDMARLGLD